VRILRLLRVFRIFRLTEYMAEFTQLGRALSASRRKILVFLSFVVMVVLVMGTVMYVVEGPENGFRSIPVARCRPALSRRLAAAHSFRIRFLPRPLSRRRYLAFSHG
jgi:hypothetical protein